MIFDINNTNNNTREYIWKFITIQFNCKTRCFSPNINEPENLNLITI